MSSGDEKYLEQLMEFLEALELLLAKVKSKVCGTSIVLGNNEIVKNAVYFQTGFTDGVTGHLDIMYKRAPAHEFYPDATKTVFWH